MSFSKRWQVFSVITLFLLGGGILMTVASPFLHSMMGLAATLGVSQFVFVQWVAPFLPEFPEKLSAFYWAKSGTKAPMAMMNLISSVINQWTVLPALMVLVYCISKGKPVPVVFDHHQKIEIVLTIAQTILASIFLLNMEMEWFDAAMLFILLFAQFILPHLREEMIFVYIFFILLEVVRTIVQKDRSFVAFRRFKEQYKNHVKRK